MKSYKIFFYIDFIQEKKLIFALKMNFFSISKLGLVLSVLETSIYRIERFNVM